MNKKSRNIGIALIHNNDNERNKIIFPNIEKLVTLLNNKFDVNFIDVAYQPDIRPVSIFKTLKKEIMNIKIISGWNKHRKLSNNYLFNLALCICNMIKNISLKNRKSSFKEIALSNKHILSWAILARESDFIIVFEDDAIFQGESFKNILSLIDKLCNAKSDYDFIYADIAGGFELDKLRIDKLEVDRDEKYRYYSKIVTNTTCAYIINRKLALSFSDVLIREPELRYITADFLINELIMHLPEKNTFCLHTFPSILLHGSNTEYFTSTIETSWSQLNYGKQV